VERAGEIRWSWSQLGWINGREFLNRAGVKRAGVSVWIYSQKGWNIWMEMKSNGLEYLE
jgi:hypothetical protein